MPGLSQLSNVKTAEDAASFGIRAGVNDIGSFQKPPHAEVIRGKVASCLSSSSVSICKHLGQKGFKARIFDKLSIYRGCQSSLDSHYNSHRMRLKLTCET